MALFKRRRIENMTFDEGVRYFANKVPGIAQKPGEPALSNQQIIDALNDYRGAIMDPNDRLAHDIYVFLARVCKYDHLEVKPTNV